MAKSDQIIALQLNEGLETKADSKLVAPTKLLTLENGEFTKYGSIRKRPGSRGYAPIVTAYTSEFSATNTAPIGSPVTLGSRDNELVMATTERLYSHDSVSGKLIRQGRYYPLVHTVDELAVLDAAQTQPTLATSDGIRVVAWLDSRASATLRMSVYVAETGAVILNDVLVASNATRPTAVPVTGGVVLLWADTSADEIKGVYLPKANVLNTYATVITYLSDLNTANSFYAATSDGENLLIAYLAAGDASEPAAGLALKSFTPSGAVQNYEVELDTTTGNIREMDMTFQVETGLVGVVYRVTSGANRVYYVTVDAATGGLDTGITAVSSINPDRVAIASHYDVSTGWGFAVAFDEYNSGSPHNSKVYTVNPTTGTRTIYHAHLVSTGFTLSSGMGAFIVGHDSRSGLQNAYYLYTSEGNLFGQVLSGEAANSASGNPMTRVWPVEGGHEAALGFIRRLDAESDNISVFTHQGIKRLLLTTSNAQNAVEVEKVLYLGGSMLWAYDGESITEAAPLMFPDMLADVPTATSPNSPDIAQSTVGGSRLDTTASYSYRVFYVWTRRNGSKVRSAAWTVTETLTGGNDTLTLTIPTLAHTLRRDDATEPDGAPYTDVVIEVYRTEGNPTSPAIYYKVSGEDPGTITGNNRFVFNDPQADSVTFVDAMPDDTAKTREVDYTTSGELYNVACPGPAFLAPVGNRLFAAGGAIPANTAVFSKITQPGGPVLFSDTGVVDGCPAAGGAITGIGEINDTPVLFKRNNIFALAGGGPDNLGGSGTFAVQSVSTDLGCVNQQSVVKIPQGLMFKSGKGIYLLDQSLGLQYVGAPVEAFNAQDITAAHTVPDTSQAIFLTNSGYTLMYDYQFNQWSSFTGHTGISACVKGLEYAYLKSDGELRIRDTSVWTDGGQFYRLKLKTGPVRLDEIVQKFSLFKRIMILGEYFTPHRLRVGLWYNREVAPYETWTWDPSTVITSSTWGSGTWGSGTWGGAIDGTTYQHEHAPKRMKNATVSIELTELVGDPPGRGFEISEIAIRVGVREGLQRIAATRKY